MNGINAHLLAADTVTDRRPVQRGVGILLKSPHSTWRTGASPCGGNSTVQNLLPVQECSQT